MQVNYFNEKDEIVKKICWETIFRNLIAMKINWLQWVTVPFRKCVIRSVNPKTDRLYDNTSLLTRILKIASFYTVFKFC